MEQNYVTVTLCILNQTRHLTGAEAEEDTTTTTTTTV